MNEYHDFIARKLRPLPPNGADVSAGDLNHRLFGHQRILTRWAIRRGRSAIFADTGLGKTAMQLEWARHATQHVGSVLILCPLAVAEQTHQEAARFGIDARICEVAEDVVDGGINIANYERLHRFDPARFRAVVLDESSIIKHHDAATLRLLLDAFRATPWKLCCSATPCPNDYMELGNHAEFLGVCSRTEMLSEFFCHDGGETQKWRLKGHARKQFWAWVASWAAMVRYPSDIGCQDDGYRLPERHTIEHVVPDEDGPREGWLFAKPAETLMERRQARARSIGARVAMCVDLINQDPGERWIVWCELNKESEALASAIDGAIEITGSQTSDEKRAHLSAFMAGQHRVLVTKPSIAGYGLNLQFCARVAFVGVTDSWESYYQAVRRTWRFGQQRKVQIHLISSAAEGGVLANLKRKEAEASAMAEELSRETRDEVAREVLGNRGVGVSYQAGEAIRIPVWVQPESEGVTK